MVQLNIADEQDASFGTIVQQHRVAARLTQEELAELAGLSVRALRDMERGHTQRPYRQSVRRVADALTLAGPARAQLLRAARATRTGPGSTPAGPGARGPASGSDPDPAGRPWSLVPMQLPARSPHFAGRAAELRELAGLLDRGRDGRAIVITVTGTAGVGKTALALHWAYEVAARYPGGQLFVDLRGFDLSGTPIRPDEVIRVFLEDLRVPRTELPASPAAQALLYRRLTAQRAMLVVFDNARDADQVRPLLPGGSSCLVIVTSRSGLAGLAVAEGAHQIALDVMSSADAYELLRQRLGADRLADELPAVGELMELCARLPLALAIAASRAAARPQVSITSLAEAIRDVQARLDSLGTGEVATSVRAVFSWSYDLLPGPAARMFRLLGLHPGPSFAVPAAASLAAMPPAEAAWLLRELTGAHLIEERAPGRYAFHDLMRMYAAEQAMAVDGAARCRAATERVIDHYLHTAHAAALLLYPPRESITLARRRPGVRPEGLADHAAALAWFTAEHETLLSACAQAVRDELGRPAWQLPWAMVHFLDALGRWDELAAIERAAVAAAERLADQNGLAHAHCDLGRACVRMARLEEAEGHLRTSLTLRERFGDDSAQARIRLDLAQVAHGQRRFRDALVEAEQALDLYQAAGSLAGQARALNNIGWYHSGLADHQRALDCCGRALAINRELGNRPGQGANLDSLGYAYLHLGRHREATACYHEALELYEALGDRYGQAVVLMHLGDAQLADSDPAAASQAWRRALAVMDVLNRPEAAQIRDRLASLRQAATGAVAAG
jgi:tetratricopeptide (TPR) repeat protein/DNA-binding XRE family transcriptional regulator